MTVDGYLPPRGGNHPRKVDHEQARWPCDPWDPWGKPELSPPGSWAATSPWGASPWGAT